MYVRNLYKWAPWRSQISHSSVWFKSSCHIGLGLNKHRTQSVKDLLFWKGSHWSNERPDVWLRAGWVLDREDGSVKLGIQKMKQSQKMYLWLTVFQWRSKLGGGRSAGCERWLTSWQWLMQGVRGEQDFHRSAHRDGMAIWQRLVLPLLHKKELWWILRKARCGRRQPDSTST